MPYLYQAIRAWLADAIRERWPAIRAWFPSKWAALKAKAAAVFQKLRARKTGDR